MICPMTKSDLNSSVEAKVIHFLGYEINNRMLMMLTQ